MLKKRTYTIGYLPNQSYCDTPCIKITGKWLKEKGFDIGNQLELIESNNMIILVKSSKKDIKKQMDNLHKEINQLYKQNELMVNE